MHKFSNDLEDTFKHDIVYQIRDTKPFLLSLSLYQMYGNHKYNFYRFLSISISILINNYIYKTCSINIIIIFYDFDKL